jgi:hypothetical protein
LADSNADGYFDREGIWHDEPMNDRDLKNNVYYACKMLFINVFLNKALKEG